MASTLVASTSATSSPTSTAAAVSRSGGGNLDCDDPVGNNASGGGGNKTASVDASGDGPGDNEKIDSHCELKAVVDNNSENSNHRQDQGQIASTQPSPGKSCSTNKKGVENEYNSKRSSSSPPLLGANNDSTISGRTVATSEKRFEEGPLPRELRRIIIEVAKTGKCSWLSWNQETTTLTLERKDMRARSSNTASSNIISANEHSFTGVSKSPSSARMASSSPSSQHPPSFTNKSTNSGVVRKQALFSGGNIAARRSTGLPPRKRHRNGAVHKSGERMRFGNPDGAYGRSNTSSNNRKRPLVITNNNNHSGSSKLNNNTTNTVLSSSATLGGLYSSAPSSVGSGRSTGSEPDYDSAQYECDSEGTSATTNSEISARRTTRAKRSGAANTQGAQINSGVDTWTDTATVCDGEDETNSVDESNAIPGSPYKTLQTAFRGALGLVLDHFYQSRGNGYKLSPAEKRRNERFAETLNKNNTSNNTDDCDSSMKSDKLSSLLSSEYVFQQRRQRLMAMLLPTIPLTGNEKQSEEPPFTIQRIAEVLIAPDRYYTQTHKLCNCLEKLLLVNSSTDSFGGSTGGDTSQRRREERELAALADEKGRQEVKLRQRRIANSKSPIDDFVADDCTEPYAVSTDELANSKAKPEAFAVKLEKEAVANNVQSTSTCAKRIATTSVDSSPSREMQEALTRASLRTKFDHVGTDAQYNIQGTTTERNVLAISENRRLTNSPPLPGLGMAPGVASNIPVSNHGDANAYNGQRVSEQQNEGHDLVSRVTSPILFSSGNEPNLEATANMNMLQFHHAVALAGVSLNRSNNAPPLDNLMTIDASSISQMRSHTNSAGAGPGSESTDGRSSASNSDIDYESDDISFDDSASDRSDGSDSGSTSAHHEPFTAARAMALNRMQQQQRLQSRVLTSLGTSHQGEGFRPPADAEYQSGDSIDSTRAEDSGGSDSSSSDLAD